LPQSREIRKTILLRQSSARVFAALVEATDLDAWWGEEPPSRTSQAPSNRAGWRSDGDSVILVRSSRQNHQLELSWRLNPDSPDPGEVAHTTVEFRLTPASHDSHLESGEQATLLTVRQIGIPADPCWNVIFNTLNNRWVTHLVYLQYWVESGRRRSDVDDPEHFATVSKSVTVPAPIDAVYEALVDPKLLASWLDATVSFDARIGGKMSILWAGGEHVGGEIVLLDQPRHAVWHWWDADKLETEDDPGMITVMTWSLANIGEQTDLTLTDRGYDRALATDAYMLDIGKGWDTCLRAIPAVIGGS